MKTTITTRIEVDIPNTPEGWDLYCGEPGAEEAAQALFNAVRTLIEQTPLTVDPLGLFSAVNTHVYPVMTKHAKLGTGDTEPRYHLRATLRRVYGEDLVDEAL
jgi:hypothetical protein